MVIESGLPSAGRCVQIRTSPSFGKQISDHFALSLRNVPQRRIAGTAGEEVAKRLSRSQGLLLDVDRNGGDPVDFGAQLCQLLALRGEAEFLAHRALVVALMIPPLLQGQVVDEAAHGEGAEKPFLLWGG
jgi:hypothetical protein